MFQALTLAAMTLTATTDAAPLLRFGSYPGFMPPQYAVASECTVYADRVEFVTYSQTGRTAVALPIAVFGDLVPIIKDAARARIDRRTGPTDAPIREHLAFYEDAHGETQEVDLGSQRDALTTENHSLAANHLRNILADLCHAGQ